MVVRIHSSISLSLFSLCLPPSCLIPFIKFLGETHTAGVYLRRKKTRKNTRVSASRPQRCFVKTRVLLESRRAAHALLSSAYCTDVKMLHQQQQPTGDGRAARGTIYREIRLLTAEPRRALRRGCGRPPCLPSREGQGCRCCCCGARCEYFVGETSMSWGGAVRRAEGGGERMPGVRRSGHTGEEGKSRKSVAQVWVTRRGQHHQRRGFL